MNEWQVGQRVLLIPSANQHRSPIEEVPIARVGKKYVYIEQYGREVAFDMYGFQKTGYPGDMQSIRTPERHARIERQERANRRLLELGVVSRGGRLPFSVEALEQVVEVLEADQRQTATPGNKPIQA